MKRIIAVLFITLVTSLLGALIPFLAHADALVPATSEDIDQFDNQIAAQRQNSPAVKSDNFGKLVSTEARKLKDSDSGQRKYFGKSVSEQRRGNDRSRETDDRRSRSDIRGAETASPASADLEGSKDSERRRSRGKRRD